MSQTEHSRLVTFEADDDELLAVIAGRSETDSRTIYQGRTEGRYAIVPVDDLDAGRAEDVEPDELRLDEMQIAGDVVPIREIGEADVELRVDGEQVVRMDRPGAYGLLWIPQD